MQSFLGGIFRLPTLSVQILFGVFRIRGCPPQKNSNGNFELFFAEIFGTVTSRDSFLHAEPPGSLMSWGYPTQKNRGNSSI